MGEIMFWVWMAEIIFYACEEQEVEFSKATDFIIDPLLMGVGILFFTAYVQYRYL